MQAQGCLEHRVGSKKITEPRITSFVLKSRETEKETNNVPVATGGFYSLPRV